MPREMKVRVHFHSYFRELTGSVREEFELEEASSVDDLRRKVEARFPKLSGLRKSTLIAVGVDYQKGDYRLRPGDEVSFFPPVQGG